MEDTLFDTPEHTKSNLAILESGRGSAFWKLMCAILDANIEVLKDLILTGSEGETPAFISLLRDRLKTYKNVRNTPEDMLKKMQSDSPEKPNLDPYSTVADLKRIRNEMAEKPIT